MQREARVCQRQLSYLSCFRPSGIAMENDFRARQHNAFNPVLIKLTKKLSYRRVTARRTILVEILSTAAHLYEKSHLKRPAIGEYVHRR